MKGDLSDTTITVSLVSHGHHEPIAELVAQMLEQPRIAKIVLTLNVPQRLELPASDRLTVIHNEQPKGYGENHNQAFLHAVGRYFVVLNPDVSLTPDLFDALVACQKSCGAALVAPSVFASDGSRQDNWRQFPTVRSLVAKSLGRDTSIVSPAGDITYPDWVAGMCILFEVNAYKNLRGFDESYYLYYEDVDICVRAWLNGMTVAGCSHARLAHDGQRASHRHWRHLRWHLASMLRYFRKYHRALGAITKPDSNHLSQN